MLIQIPNLLTAEQVKEFRGILDSAEWADGKITAGYQSGMVKNNLQLQENSPEARKLSNMVIEALDKNKLFFSAALPLKIYPPLFNRYEGGQNFGTHVDNAIRQISGTPHRIRTDLSATLFLSGQEEYDGGELVVEDTYGTKKVKLPAGDMILYPATSLHHVTPVMRGVRVASFFWIQSMVRDDGQRTILFDLDMSIQKIHQDMPNHNSAVSLTGVYHNLLRQWAEV